jgi:hypothetical protein
MANDPKKALDKILKNLEDLVNAEKEDTVRRLQRDINEAFKKASDNFGPKFSMAAKPAARKVET